RENPRASFLARRLAVRPQRRPALLGREGGTASRALHPRLRGAEATIARWPDRAESPPQPPRAAAGPIDPATRRDCAGGALVPDSPVRYSGPRRSFASLPLIARPR